MTIYIKNMVCVRCKMVVSAELTHVGLQYSNVDLGQADIIGDISRAQHEQIYSLAIPIYLIHARCCRPQT